MEHVDKAIVIDQSPIGRTPRSNAATYTGVFDLIRALFAETTLSKERDTNQAISPSMFEAGGASRAKVRDHRSWR